MVVLRKPQAFGCVRTLFVAGLLATLAGSGCETAAGTGAVSGGLIGAGVGGLLSHCPGGALLGGAIGAGAGTLAGAGVDIARDKRAQRAVAADVAMRAPSLEQIVDMTQKAIPPAQIIEQIRTSGAVYRVSPEQLVWLNQQGVNDAVIRELQDSVYRGPRRVYAPVTVVEQPVYVAPPPVAVGVGIGWGGRSWR